MSCSIYAEQALLHDRGMGTPSEEEDVVILRRIARGEQQALGELYDRHAHVLASLGMRFVRDRRDAEDIVHDVFLEAWRSIGDYDPARGSVRSWLLIRMRARCLDRVRSHGYSRTEPLSLRHERVDPASEVAELAADNARVLAVLEELPEPQRTVLELGYLHGLSFSEIAEKLGIPLGTVKSRVSAAMSKLRKDLKVSNRGNAA